jgi:hypothetical protein
VAWQGRPPCPTATLALECTSHLCCTPARWGMLAIRGDCWLAMLAHIASLPRPMATPAPLNATCCCRALEPAGKEGFSTRVVNHHMHTTEMWVHTWDQPAPNSTGADSAGGVMVGLHFTKALWDRVERKRSLWIGGGARDSKDLIDEQQAGFTNVQALDCSSSTQPITTCFAVEQLKREHVCRE